MMNCIVSHFNYIPNLNVWKVNNEEPAILGLSKLISDTVGTEDVKKVVLIWCDEPSESVHSIKFSFLHWENELPVFVDNEGNILIPTNHQDFFNRINRKEKTFYLEIIKNYGQ